MPRRMECLTGNSKVFPNRDAFKQHVLLKRARQAAARHKIRTALPYRNAMDQNFTACRRFPTRDQIEERGLAGTIWSNYGVSLTIRNREIQIGDNFQPTEGLSQIPDFECAHRHFPISVRRVPRMPPR